MKVLKLLQQELIHPSLGCMPLYCLGRKLNSNDDIVIVSEVMSRKINFVLQDMGASIINQKMLKNPHVDKKIKISVQKCPLVEDTKKKKLYKRNPK
jgi:hypothetical protein